MHTKRLSHIDLMRVITIFFMMMTHVVSGSWHNQPVTGGNWMVLNVYDSLVRFTVPLFVMISGIFFLDPKKALTFRALFQKYIWRIVTAFLFWSFLYAVGGNWLTYGALSKVFLVGVAKDFVGGRYHLWFLFMIVGLYLVTPFLRRITESRQLMQYFLALAILFGMVVPALRLWPLADKALSPVVDKMHLHLVLGYTGAFVSGYYFHRYPLSRRWRYVIYALGVISVIITALGTRLLSVAAGEPVDTLYSTTLPTTYCTALAVFLLFDNGLSHRTFSEKTANRLAWLSKISFGMYLVHDLFIQVFEKFLHLTAVSFSPVLAVPLLTGAVFILSFLASWALSKIPWLNKYIL